MATQMNLTPSHGKQQNGNGASSFVLRPHQTAAIDMTWKSLRSGKRRPMMQLPCGGGKTVISAEMFNRALSKQKRAIFTVPSISLIDQTYQRFFQAGIRDVGIIQANHPLTNLDAPIQIASVQTLMRRKIPPADLVIIDESHLRWKFYSKWMSDPDWARVPFIGLSGTPWSKGLGKDFDDLLVPSTAKALMADGFLSPYRIFAPTLPGARPNLDGVPTVNTPHGRDFEEATLSERMQKPTLVADCVETWLEKGQNLPTLVFCVNRAHAQTVEQRYREAGVTTAYVDMNTSRQEREEIGRKFNSGEIRIVTSVGTMIVGVDWDVRCIQFLRPTKSEIIWVQACSRGLRLADGKDCLILLDHSDNTKRLGFPTDIHHEFLDDGTPLTPEAKKKQKEEREERLPQECLYCGFLKPKGCARCPDCGKGGRISDIETAPGELVEMRPGQVRQLEMADPNTKQLWYSQLLWVQDQRGYKPHWADNQMKNRFGVWPRSLSRIRTTAGQEVLNYVKSQLIRWANSRRRVA